MASGLEFTNTYKDIAICIKERKLLEPYFCWYIKIPKDKFNVKILADENEESLRNGLEVDEKYYTLAELFDTVNNTTIPLITDYQREWTYFVDHPDYIIIGVDYIHCNVSIIDITEEIYRNIDNILSTKK